MNRPIAPPLTVLACALATLGSGSALANAQAAQSVPVVIVTGEKLGRALERTLTSTAVATARELDEHNDNTLTDMMARTVGVSTAPNNQTFSIRGMPVAGLGDQGSNDLISVYVDGAVQPRQNVTLGTLSSWDMEQVEVLRGPQSTVQGRNAMAGAIVLQSKNPTYEPTFRAQLRAGANSERAAAFAAGGGLIGKILAGRVSVEKADDDGYIYNETLAKPANTRDSLTARGKLLWQPSSQVDALLTFSHTDHRRGNPVVTQENGDLLYYRVRTNADAWDKLRQNSAIAQVDYRINPAWTLHGTMALTQTQYDSVLDFDQMAKAPVDEVLREHRQQLASHEARLVYRRPGLVGHMGVCAGRNHEERGDRLLFDGAQIIALAGDTQVRNRALFGEVNWTFLPRWDLIAGLRYDRERNRIASRYDDEPDTVTPGRYHAWLPKLGLSYDLSANQMLGAVVQRGYRGGGSAFNIAEQTAVAFDPEYSTNYELSYRGRLLDRRLQVQANTYLTNWDDQQVSYLTIAGNENSAQVANAGSARLYGAEVSASYNLSPAVRAYGAIAVNRTRYLDFRSTTQDLSGRAFQRAPARQANLGLRWRPSAALSLAAEVTYQSSSVSQYLTEDDPASPRYSSVTDTLRGDSATLINLNAHYTIGQWRLSAYIRNLGDRAYAVNRPSGAVATAGAPRLAGVSLNYEM